MKAYLVFALNFSLSQLAPADNKVEHFYEVRGISFSENGFPKSIKIRLTSSSATGLLPAQGLLASNGDLMMESVSDFKRTTTKAGLEAVEFTLDMESYLPMKFFDPKEPSRWWLRRIAGPRMPVGPRENFVVLIDSDEHLIGFSIGPLGADESARVRQAARQRIKQAEQDGAGQPATRPESKPEGRDKPQPEAEGRSR